MRETVVYAVGVAISPVPIASALLLLTSSRALANGASFAAGWALGVAGLALLFVVLVDRAGIGDANPHWIAVPELVVGSAFLAGVAGLLVRRTGRTRRSRPWIAAVDDLTRSRAAGLGVILSAANPKVVALALGAALSLAEIGASATTAARTVVLFAAIGVTGVALPLALYALLPEHAAPALSRLRIWLGRHETRVLVVLGLVIGVVFLRDGVASL